jgi:phosphoglucosamine mutase
VREGRLDAGIALDGDADRCVLVDERGEVVHGDALTWCLARDLGVDGLAVTVMSNAALEPALPGVIVHRTPVGDRHLQAAMRAHGLLLGAEESGHVLFGDFPGGDGMLTGVRALAAAWRAAPTLSAAVRGFLPWPDARAKVRVSRRPPLQSLDGYEARVAAATARLAGGRVLLRYSGTEPILRVLVEGPDAAVVAAVRDELAAWAAEVLA